jgi:hypothetical protein
MQQLLASGEGFSVVLHTFLWCMLLLLLTRVLLLLLPLCCCCCQTLDNIDWTFVARQMGTRTSRQVRSSTSTRVQQAQNISSNMSFQG